MDHGFQAERLATRRLDDVQLLPICQRRLKTEQKRHGVSVQQLSGEPAT
ncbi:hypothetical protein BH24CHL6_BH24CHL6_08430 [soil metagenome]